MSVAAPFDRVLLGGLGVTNSAVAEALVRRGAEVVALDDGAPEALEETGARLGIEVHHQPSTEAIDRLVATVHAVLPAPGLPESHPVFAAAQGAGVPVASEFDLAALWDDRPLLAVTGTNGKTTVVMLIAEMLRASGTPCAAVGNTEVPLVAAIDDPVPACFVVEASSFRLGHSRHFAPRVGTWLNFAPDHLDVHRDLGAYLAAKERIWAEQTPGQVAVANLEDPVVAAALPHRPGVREWGYGIGAEAAAAGARFVEVDGVLRCAEGDLAEVGELWSPLAHDRSNALAAAATALAGGGAIGGVRRALAGFRGLPHRVELVADHEGVRWYDDSKATAPHATVSAASGFERVVLIAGGRNKGLDLRALGAASSVVAVVGIGESADEVTAVFADRPSRRAGSMAEAVAAAAELAADLEGSATSGGAGGGTVVLLSPGCASFDWYSSYGERGDDFTAEVRSLLGASR